MERAGDQHRYYGGARRDDQRQKNPAVGRVGSRFMPGPRRAKACHAIRIATRRFKENLQSLQTCEGRRAPNAPGLCFRLVPGMAQWYKHRIEEAWK